MPDPNVFFWIAASFADAAAINPYGIKTLLANGLNTSPIKGYFSNDPKSLARNPPDCSILFNWVFYNFILSEEILAKVLLSFQTCILVNNNLCRKLFSSLESSTTLEEIFKLLQYQFLFQILIY